MLPYCIIADIPAFETRHLSPIKHFALFCLPWVQFQNSPLSEIDCVGQTLLQLGPGVLL